MSRQFDAKQEALAAYPDDRAAGVELFLDFLETLESEFRYCEGMSPEEYIYGPPENVDGEGNLGGTEQ